MTAKSSIINFEMTNFSEKSLLTTQRLIELVDQRDDQDALRKIGGLNGILEKLSSSIDGIPSHTIENRREVWGSNMMPKESPITFLDLLKNAFSDKTIILLVIAAVISIIVGTTTRDPTSGEYHPEEGWIEGFAIVVSIVIVVMATTINDYKKEQKFQKLTELGERTDIVVLRDGVEVTIDIAELVVGDICMISSGLVIPADGLFVKGQSVVVDESSATGENDPKKKNTTAPFFLSSTTVNTAENAWMLVICVGVNSFGRRLLNATGACGEIRATPLQDKLNDIAEMIGKIGLVTAVVLFCCLSVIEVFQFAWKSNDAHASDFLTYFIIAVSVVVVAVPEGLPLAVTIALAYSQSQMMADNNQVRRLVACETMGNSTQICSDKTGTLTQNLMSVKQVFICGKHIPLEYGVMLTNMNTVQHVPEHVQQKLFEAISLNSTSTKVLQNGEWIWRNDMGNKTENGMLDFVDRVALSEMSGAMLPHQILRERAPHRFLYPFTSERKRMSVLIRSKTNELMWSTFYVKGASEKILELCTHYYDSNGKVEPLASHARNEISEYITRYAKDANRTIGVAVADGLQITDLEPEEPSGIPLTWIGVLGIQDPLRPGVPEAVQKCQGAGVTVRMCTGDNLETAIAISRECGIYDEQKGHIALTGAAFRDIVYRKDKSPYKEQRELERTLENMTVLARSQPLDKQLLVLMLMMQGEVVAVTGDGTNDAPALKLANVGFVMKSGTDIAVRSADIVLLDNNFRSVERAVVWGRTVNDNIRKFLQFQLCVNIVCVGLTFIGSLTAEGHFPIESVQLLWVNLMMDTLAALALATELPNEACLNRGPIPRKAPVISRRMWRFIICHAAYQLIITILLLHNAHVWFNIRPEKIIVNGMEAQKLKFNREHLTVVFNVFVFAIIFNEFNARLLYDETNIFSGLKRSLWFIAIIIIMIVVQVLAVQVGGDFMKTKPLSTELWIVSILFGLGSWLFGYLFRYIPINEPEYEKVFDEDELDSDSKRFLLEVRSNLIGN